MNTLSLYYPVEPHTVNRAWGVKDALYLEYGFSRHNGVDLDLHEGQEIRAPFKAKVTLIGNQPDGSGNFVCILSREKYRFEDGKHAHVELTFMHLAKPCVSVGMKVEVGDLLALGGRTGRATGTHVHLAPKRVRRGVFGYRDFDRNDADNTFDPAPYWNGMYARRDA
ncbi:MAG: M23 family metallopeptidase [Patescibacteria group bacterium]